MLDAMETTTFTLSEILSVIGLVQCVYILVYIAFRAGNLRSVFLPCLYFLVLSLAFLSDFSLRSYSDTVPHLGYISWACWFMGPPLGVLLLIQMTQITTLPPIRSYWVLFLVPVALGCGLVLARAFPDTTQMEWLTLTGLLAGVVSLGTMAMHYRLLSHVQDQPGGRDRYWLMVTLVLVNLLMLAVMLLSLTPVLDGTDAAMIRTICGISFAYLAGTSLFRIYPQAARLVAPKTVLHKAPLSAEDQAIAQRIQDLLEHDKVYQEPSYNRANLAKELGISESQVSRVVNQHFGRTLPQIFADLRMNDAKRLLIETDAPIRTVAENAGFNSLASFNRVFKEQEGQTPGQFRDQQKKSV